MGIGTVIHITSFAEKAFSTKGFHIHRNPVSLPEASDRFSGLFYHTDKLMAQDGSWHRPRYGAVFDVDVAGTDGGQRHPDDGVRRLLQLRNRPFFQRQFSVSFIYHCFQFFSSSLKRHKTAG